MPTAVEFIYDQSSNFVIMKSLLILTLLSVILVGSVGINLVYSDSGTISQDKTWDFPLPRGINGFYTEDGANTALLEVGQQAYIVFSLRDSKQQYLDKIDASYQIVEDENFPRSNDESITVSKDSLDMFMPLSALFVPEKPGSYFLRQTTTYTDKHDTVPSGGNYQKNMPFDVISKFSNAIMNDGSCKNADLSIYIKSDFSTAVCVTHSTSVQLLQRGY